MIAKYVKERKVLTLPEAVRKMTGWPATRMRLANRGTIAVGNWADVTIFDYDTLQDGATYERPMEFPTGIEWVLVNGTVTIDHGKHTEQRRAGCSGVLARRCRKAPNYGRALSYRLSARPAIAPLNFPSSMATVPFTSTNFIPVASSSGSR